MNRFVWEVYRESPSGKKALRRAFPRYARFGRHPGISGWQDQLNPVLAVYLATPGDIEVPMDECGWRPLRDPLQLWFQNLNDAPAYEQRYRELLQDGASYEWDHDQLPDKKYVVIFGGASDEDAQTVANSVGATSTVLHWLAPDNFFPYYFEGRFALFVNICQTFGIDLPDIPGKLQKKERALYYLTVNRAVQEFRQRHQMSPQELNAFLYDFAPRYLAVEQDKDLPQPQRVWFLMAGVATTDDFDFLDNADASSESHWRGHRDARRGDVAVVWCASPRAYMHSVWRIVEDGYDDPFAYWYSMVRIGHPIPVAHLKIKDLKANPILAESTMVRACFQGCAGRYFRPIDYAAMLEEMQRHGTDISRLPRIHITALPDMPTGEVILDERQVELQLIEPLLLNKLGYQEASHWQRQVRVRMGRGEKVYPDYLIGYRGGKGEERAEIVIESKYRIATQKELFETFLQGRSYALRLQASWLLLAALEGVWLLSKTDDFKLESALEWSWEKLVQVEHFSVLEKAIGHEALAQAEHKPTRLGRSKA